MSDVVPFLKAVAAASKQPLQSALPQLPSKPATSPWSPQPQAPPPAAPVAEAPKIDVEAITAKAIEDGRAQGLRETEELRETLARLVGELEQARQAVIAPTTEMIAAAATTVIEGWLGATDRGALFAPVITSWLTTESKTGVARCHPDDVEPLRAAIGDAELQIVADPQIKLGDVTIADATRELAQTWEPRLRELREAIAAALAEP